MIITHPQLVNIQVRLAGVCRVGSSRSWHAQVQVYDDEYNYDEEDEALLQRKLAAIKRRVFVM